MKELYKDFMVSVVAVLGGLVVLDLFGIAEQGSLKIAHRGTVGRRAVGVKQTVVRQTAGLYQ